MFVDKRYYEDDRPIKEAIFTDSGGNYHLKVERDQTTCKLAIYKKNVSGTGYAIHSKLLNKDDARELAKILNNIANQL